MSQSYKLSVIEIGTNLAVGLVLAWIGNRYLALWILGIHMSGNQSAGLVILFTILSLLRQWILRRLFNLIES